LIIGAGLLYGGLKISEGDSSVDIPYAVVFRIGDVVGALGILFIIIAIITFIMSVYKCHTYSLM
jgi:hypothetical protein